MVDSQEFLKQLEKKLWRAADKLRGSLDAANYKHAVLGLIFLKYVSDAFQQRRDELNVDLRNPEHEDYLNPKFCDDIEAEIKAELEDRDSYTAVNLFWVPPLARWEFLLKHSRLLPGTPIYPEKEKRYSFNSLGQMIDDALTQLELENPRLKGVVNKTYTRLPVTQGKLADLMCVIATIPFEHESLQSRDILGHVYEYFLGQFARAEGKKGGQYYTPKSIVNLVVEILQPYEGRIYDPAMGSGGFFVQSQEFIRAHQGKSEEVSIFGQELNWTTWKLAAMNLAIRGIDYNFGNGPADTFLNNQHPNLRADFVMANPPFNMKDWWNESLNGDTRWKFGIPPKGNANFAWLQHMLYHLSSTGRIGLVLSNGSMSSSLKAEERIRTELVKQKKLECLISLPAQLFYNTQIPACLWILSNLEQSAHNPEVLFIDARHMGFMKRRNQRDFSEAEIQKITQTYHNWRVSVGLAPTITGKVSNYKDEPGFCKSANLKDIEEHGFVLAPGRYVGVKAEERDAEPFNKKMKRLTSNLDQKLKKNSGYSKEIRKSLSGLGYDI